jgi:hypothetical protein
MDSRTNPMAPNTIGDDSASEEIAGEQEPLKVHEDGPAPPPGALDYAFADTSPTENPLSDPGLVRGSRDPDGASSLEDDDTPGTKEGGTPYDAEGSSGAAGQ